jgi:hypothetical protein
MGRRHRKNKGKYKYGNKREDIKRWDDGKIRKIREEIGERGN